MTENMMSKLTEILLNNLNVSEDELSPKANFKTDLGADSLDLVEIIMAVENEFDIEISDDEIAKINTVGDALAILENKKK